jgi:hypothetical protein
MDQKAVTRLAVIRAMNSVFDGITDDDHALFTFETLAEFPQDQRVSAIDVAGAHVRWDYKNLPFNRLAELMDTRVKYYAHEVELNTLANNL